MADEEELRNETLHFLLEASYRLLRALKQHAVPEVLTGDAARNDIENAIAEVEYTLSEMGPSR